MRKTNLNEKKFMPDELKKEIDLIMHPEKDDTPPKISLIFSLGENNNDIKKQDIKDKLANIKHYATYLKNNLLFYRIDFKLNEVRKIYDTYQIIKDLPHKEILITYYKLPYSGSLWLMLLWYYL